MALEFVDTSLNAATTAGSYSRSLLLTYPQYIVGDLIVWMIGAQALNLDSINNGDGGVAWEPSPMEVVFANEKMAVLYRVLDGTEPSQNSNAYLEVSSGSAGVSRAWQFRGFDPNNIAYVVSNVVNGTASNTPGPEVNIDNRRQFVISHCQFRRGGTVAWPSPDSGHPNYDGWNGAVGQDGVMTYRQYSVNQRFLYDNEPGPTGTYKWTDLGTAFTDTNLYLITFAIPEETSETPVDIDVTNTADISISGFAPEVEIIAHNAEVEALTKTVTLNTFAPTVSATTTAGVPEFLGHTQNLNLNNLEANMGEPIRPGDVLMVVGRRLSSDTITLPDNTTQIISTSYPTLPGYSTLRLRAGYKISTGVKDQDAFTGQGVGSWRLLCFRNVDPARGFSNATGAVNATLSTSGHELGGASANLRVWVGGSEYNCGPDSRMNALVTGTTFSYAWENPEQQESRTGSGSTGGQNRAFLTNFKVREEAFVQDATVTLGSTPQLQFAGPSSPTIGAGADLEPELGTLQLRGNRPTLFPPVLVSDQYFTNFGEHLNQAGMPNGWSELIQPANKHNSWSIANSNLTNGKWLTINQYHTNDLYEARWDMVGDQLADAELYLRFFIRQTAPLVWLRGKGHNTKGYYLWWGFGQFGLNYYDGVTDHELAVTNQAISGSSAYRLRFRIDGSRLRARFWADSSPEPATWRFDVNNQGMDKGHFSVSGMYPSFAFEAVGIGINGASAPTSALPVIITPTPKTMTLNSFAPESVEAGNTSIEAPGQLQLRPFFAQVTPALPDANVLFVGSTVQPYLKVIDFDSNAIDPEWPTLPGAVIDGQFGNQRGVAVHDEGNQLTVFDVLKKETVSGYPSLPAEPWAAAMSATHIATGTRRYTSNSNFGGNAGNTITNSLRVIDIETKQVVQVPEVASTVFALAFSPNGNRLAIGCAQAPFLRVLNLTTGFFEAWDQPESMVTDIVWQADHFYVAGPGGVQRYNVSSRELTDTLLEGNVWAMAITSGGGRIAAVGEEYSIISTHTNQVTKLTNPALKQALGKSVAWVTDKHIAVGFLWYDNNERKGLFIDVETDGLVSSNYPEIEGTIYLLDGGKVDTAQQPNDVVIEAGTGNINLFGRTPVVEMLIQIEPPSTIMIFDTFEPEVEAPTQNVQVDVATARVTFNAFLPTVVPLTAMITAGKGLVTFRGRTPQISASSESDFKLVSASDTSMTARDAGKLDELDLGLVFYGGRVGSKFRIGNTTNSRQNFLVFASSANQKLASGVEFSLDGRSWSDSITTTVAANRMSDVIHMRLTVPGGSPIGDSTFLINIEGGMSL